MIQRALNLPPKFKPRSVLVHYSEIALKGKNRAYFEQALVRSLERGLRGLGVARVKRLYGRILVEFHDAVQADEVSERLGSVYGIAHFEPATRTRLDLETIEATIGELIEGTSVESFAIATQRPNKQFPLNSMQVNHRIGQFVVDRTGWRVCIDSPELPIHIFILDNEAYVAFGRLPGPGGLPFGVAGKVACLLSGGIDSPVAANRIIRRGAAPFFVHFHSAPHTSAASQDKVIELASHIMRHHRRTRLYMVPFAELQQRIVTEAEAGYRIVLYRRFMIRAAERIAREEGARALVTGESLSQVSSQTLENLSTIDDVAELPILRPVIGWDKQEIIEEARDIGTFEVSIEPHDDCCSYLMPQHPVTRSRPADLERIEERFDVEAEVARLVDGAEVVLVGMA